MFKHCFRGSCRTSLHRWLGVLLVANAATLLAQARVVRIVVERRESPAFAGREFAGVGRYEKIVGRAAGELDPNDPHNKLITDIQLAPRNARGMVEYETDFYLVKPVDAAKGNGLLFYHVANRGGKDDPVHFGMKGGNDLTDPGALEYLMRYDSTHGRLELPVALADGVSHICTLDVDSFPIDDAWIDVLVASAPPASGLTGVLRVENGDVALPHPSCILEIGRAHV